MTNDKGGRVPELHMGKGSYPVEGGAHILSFEAHAPKVFIPCRDLFASFVTQPTWKRLHLGKWVRREVPAACKTAAPGLTPALHVATGAALPPIAIVTR